MAGGGLACDAQAVIIGIESVQSKLALVIYKSCGSSGLKDMQLGRGGGGPDYAKIPQGMTRRGRGHRRTSKRLTTVIMVRPM